MKRLVGLVLVALFALLPVGAAIAQEATPEASPAAEAPTVFVRQDPALGPYLSDPAGMSLYIFSNDTVAGESTCYDDCATAWPPFTAEEPLSLPFTVDGELTLIERTDGTMQVAYNGMPLYYWQNDTQPGDVTGHGVGDVWWLVAPGSQMGVAAATPAATPMAAEMAGTPVAGGEVAVSLIDFSVDANVTTFQVGQEYTFQISNIGSMTHEFYVEIAGADGEPLEADGMEAEVEDIEAGATASLVWTFTEPGNYQFACHIGSHYPAGMALNITVVE
jgi:predicted lipoprotein with Yx(FWY)xxD motif/uncharacterized cupredoxin-like copper-binding protein